MAYIGLDMSTVVSDDPSFTYAIYNICVLCHGKVECIDTSVRGSTPAWTLPPNGCSALVKENKWWAQTSYSSISVTRSALRMVFQI